MSDFDPINDYEPHGFSADYARKVTNGYSSHLPSERPMTTPYDASTSATVGATRRAFELAYDKTTWLQAADYDRAVAAAVDYIAALEAELAATRAQLAAATGALEGAKGILWYIMSMQGGIQAHFDGWKAVRNGDYVDVLPIEQAATPPAGAANEEAR